MDTVQMLFQMSIPFKARRAVFAGKFSPAFVYITHVLPQFLKVTMTMRTITAVIPLRVNVDGGRWQSRGVSVQAILTPTTLSAYTLSYLLPQLLPIVFLLFSMIKFTPPVIDGFPVVVLARVVASAGIRYRLNRKANATHSRMDTITRAGTVFKVVATFGVVADLLRDQFFLPPSPLLLLLLC